MAYRTMGKAAGRGGESSGHRFHGRGKQRTGNIKISNDGTHFITHYLCISVCTEIFCTGDDNGSCEGIMHFEKMCNTKAHKKGGNIV